MRTVKDQGLWMMKKKANEPEEKEEGGGDELERVPNEQLKNELPKGEWF